MSEQNVELIRRLNAAWTADPFNPPLEYLDPEIEWETRWPGLPHHFYGHEGVRNWVERVLEPMQIELELVEARSVGDDAVLAEYLARGEGRGSSVRTEMRIFDLYWIRDGLVHRRRTFYSEAEALEAI